MKVSEPVVVMNEPGKKGHDSTDLNDGPEEDPDIDEQ